MMKDRALVQPSVVLLALVALVVVASLGVAGGVLLSDSYLARPSQFSQATEPTSAPVSSRSYRDPHRVTVSFIRTEVPSLVSPVSGKVTGVDCVPAMGIASGARVFTVGGTPVVAVHTRVPLWRGFSLWDKGDDVTALQEALAFLGQSVEADGVYGYSTDRALRSIFRNAGMDLSAYDPVPFDHLLWIPSPSVTVESCLLWLGQDVGSGQAIIDLPRQLTRIVVQDPAAERMPGQRVLTLDALVIPTPDDGIVSAPEQLAQVSDSPQYQYGISSSGDAVVQLDMEWTLLEPMEVFAVPPRAVFSLSDGRGCVAAGDSVLAVTVVASSLGSVLVTFDSQTPPVMVSLMARGSSCQ